MNAQTFKRLINLWPPFLFNSIQVTRIAQDWGAVEVRLRLRRWNRNYVGTQFGGNLFAMTDPFWMLMIMQRLGPDYFVWDKAGEIEFITPGRSDVYASFVLDDSVLNALRVEADTGKKVLRWFDTQVVDPSGGVIARVRKQIYLKRKPAREPA